MVTHPSTDYSVSPYPSPSPSPPPAYSSIVYSVYVAQYEEYTRPLIDHLVHYKLNHWDR